MKERQSLLAAVTLLAVLTALVIWLRPTRGQLEGPAEVGGGFTGPSVVIPDSQMDNAWVPGLQDEDLTRRVAALEARAGFNSDSEPNLGQLVQRISSLEERLSRLESEQRHRARGNTSTDGPIQLVGITSDLRRLEQRISSLERPDPAMPLQDSLRELSSSVNRIHNELHDVKRRLRDVERD